MTTCDKKIVIMNPRNNIRFVWNVLTVCGVLGLVGYGYTWPRRKEEARWAKLTETQRGFETDLWEIEHEYKEGYGEFRG